jgi:hypothetical protein
MSTATVKGQYTRDEAEIRALVEAIEKAITTKTPLRSRPPMRKTRLFVISHRLFPIAGWTYRQNRRGSTHGKGQSSVSRAISTLP